MVMNSFVQAFRLILLALAFLASSLGYADETVACPPPPENPDVSPAAVQAGLRNAKDHGFLWRISKGGHTSYLYGTVHVGKLEWSYPGPSLVQALRETDTVALEVDMADAAIRERLASLMRASAGEPLPYALVQRIRQQAVAACVSYEALAGMAPELQVALLAVTMARRDGLEGDYAADLMLAGFGHSAQRDVISLESPELQMKAMRMGSRKETEALVAVTLDEIEGGRVRTHVARMVRAWVESNYGEMENYPTWCECMNTAVERKMMKRLLEGRNPALAVRIDKLHGSGRKVFAAVGSLHMFGATGLPSLMEKRGYRVERVTLAERKAPAGE